MSALDRLYMWFRVNGHLLDDVAPGDSAAAAEAEAISSELIEVLEALEAELDRKGEEG